MYLLLLRHGEAEKITGGMTDADRQLTQAGIRAMSAVLPDVVRLMPARGHKVFWTSPLIRARQSARIAVNAICDVSGDSKMAQSALIEKEELTLTGIDELLVQLAGACKDPEMKPEDTLVLTGHDPQMSRLAAHLTGIDIRFGKGAAMCLQLAAPEAAAEDTESVKAAFAGAGKLLWFVQGPDFSRWKRLVDLEQILGERYVRVKENYSKFNCGDTSADMVHDLRVSIRTLRSLVRFVAPYQKKRQNRRMQRSLRKIVAQLSRLREYDVLVEEAAKADISQSPDGDSQVYSVKLETELMELRSKECARVLREYDNRRFTRLLFSLDEDFSEIEWRSETAKGGIGPGVLEKRFAGINAKFEDAWNKLDFRDCDASHKVRKMAKQVRYDAAGMKSLIGKNPGTVAAMKQVQDELGELCDARVNAALLEDLRRQGKRLSRTALRQMDNLIASERAREKALVQKLCAQKAADSDKN